MTAKILLWSILVNQCYGLKCFVCEESLDHNGNIIGSGSPGCFSGDEISQYSQECPPGYNYCGLEFAADWLPRGFQQLKVIRRCRPTPTVDDCITSTLTGFQYKDCITACESDNCNEKTDEIFDLASTRDPLTGLPREINCYSCSSDFDKEDDVNNMPYCYSTPAEQEGGIECPIYANAGCFKSKTLVERENGDSEEHYFKGCSVFPNKEKLEDNEVECVTSDGIPVGENWLMCDAVCDGVKGAPCNGGTPKGAGKMCFTCEATLNHEGQMVGWGDPSCVTDPHRYQLELCDEDHDICVTEFKAEWKLLGQQQFTMRRGCGRSADVVEDCLTVQAGNYKAKECTETCRDLNLAGCNNGTEIFNQFRVSKVDTCRTCSDHVYGNQAPTDCASDPATAAECPVYATAGCFSSRYVYDTNGLQESDTYHGCSAFRTNQDNKECFTVNVENGFNQPSTKKTTCKESCTTDECNQSITEIIQDPIQEHFCAVCSVRMDHFNNTVGEGDPRCWGEDIPSKFYTQCPSGQNFCVVDIEVDWSATGDQTTTLKRSCSSEPRAEGCVSGAIQTWQYKDCSTTCSDNLLSACNTDMYETALLFSQGSQATKTCYNCETHTDGDHFNDCGPNFEGPNASRNIVMCPKYADKGCFTSILKHEENNKAFEDIIRGCSTFDQEYACSGFKQRQLDQDGEATGEFVEWNACKEACRGNNCNNEKIQVAGDNRCYVCTAQRDSHGNGLGLRDEFCFSELIDGNEASVIVDCGRDEYCITDMEVDWLPRGEQITSIRKRCGKEPVESKCVSSVTNAWAAKDCVSSCKGTLCNNNLEIANMLDEGIVSECYSCKFDELRGQDAEDNQQCKENPLEATKQTCPRWATSACFVADTVVRQEDGSGLTEIYRGCSSFSRGFNKRFLSKFIVKNSKYRQKTFFVVK